MKMQAWRVPSICLLFAASGALAEESPQVSSAAAKSAYSNKLICTREHVTGSMIRKKVCKTQEQIDREHQQSQQYAEEIRRNSSWSTKQSDH